MKNNDWTTTLSEQLYKVSRWGEGYFEINEKGHMTVNPDEGETRIDMIKVVEEMKAKGVEFPAVIRFHDILWSKVIQLNQSFQKTIKEEGYEGTYRGVYPIKVNQMREVVEEIIASGEPFDFGLEAGSIAELLAVLAFNTNENSLTVLNGYKDKQYMRLAMMGRKMGREIIVVIERISELDLILNVAQEFGVKPLIGVRSKLSIQSVGKWKDSSGERAKFGLSVSEILKVTNSLKEKGFLDCFKLLHFHIGSQITDIRSIKESINEATRIYSRLYQMGVGVDTIDVGGGLGVDYDGTRSTNSSSKNYSLEEYVADVVYGIKEVCNLENVPHPDIVSESGRALTAQHSCVVTEVIDVIDPIESLYKMHKENNEHHLVKSARYIYENITSENFQEYYNDILKVKEDTLNSFRLGILNLEQRAKVETYAIETLKKISELIQSAEFVPDEFWAIGNRLAPQYLCNFSVFQSAADHWAIDQILPVVPLQRLGEKPDIEATLVDITCDSDGKMCQFTGSQEDQSTLKVHSLIKDENYYLGIFLTGAYQDVMGDMHNLFGRLNEVHVYCDEEDPDNFYIEEIIKGSSAGKVLSTMQYTPESMVHLIKRKMNTLIKENKIQSREGVRLVDFYESCLKSYTYLEGGFSSKL